LGKPDVLGASLKVAVHVDDNYRYDTYLLELHNGFRYANPKDAIEVYRVQNQGSKNVAVVFRLHEYWDNFTLISTHYFEPTNSNVPPIGPID